MPTRALHRGVALGGLLLALLAILAPAVPATAAAPTSAETSTESAECALAEPTDDEVLSILGRICDRRESPQAPVEGVDFTLEDDAGEVVAEATSGADGTFQLDLPGSSVENLGKKFTIKLDESTLPEDTTPEIVERTVSINLDTDQSVTFPIGAAGPGGTGFATEALQLTVGGIVFSVLLAMSALGLSMIFGTTG
jgi:hypothetical protein